MRSEASISPALSDYFMKEHLRRLEEESTFWDLLTDPFAWRSRCACGGNFWRMEGKTKICGACGGVVAAREQTIRFRTYGKDGCDAK
jgi:hypothetical protein